MNELLSQKFKDFLDETNFEELNLIWERQSYKFKEFWQKEVMVKKDSLTDSEIDEIILILDKNAKGSTKETVAVA